MSQQTLVFSGACDYPKVNGLKFDRQGTTATGAPFYKARTTERYIYYDPNCATPGSPQPARWILDNNAPNTQRTADLDGDGECNYLARTESNDKKSPPSSALWSMHCGSDDWQLLTITLQKNGTETQALMSTAMGWHRNLAAWGLLFPTLTWALSCRLG